MAHQWWQVQNAQDAGGDRDPDAARQNQSVNLP